MSNFSHAFYFNSRLPHYLGRGGDYDGEEDVHKLVITVSLSLIKQSVVSVVHKAVLMNIGL